MSKLLALEVHLSTVECMADKKQTGRGGDRHKPGRQMRVQPLFALALDVLAACNGTTAPQEANRGARELLIREGLYPLAPEDVKDIQATEDPLRLQKIAERIRARNRGADDQG